MTKAIAAVGFDYEGIDKDTKGKLLSLAGEVRRSTKSHIDYAIKMGEAVAQANELLATAGCEGKFGPWVQAECGFSKRSAYNYMNAFLRFGDESCKLALFTAEAIYLLSEDSTPESACKKALKLADKGKRITRDQAAELKKEAIADEAEEEEPEVDEPDESQVVEPVAVSEAATAWTPPEGVMKFNDPFDPATDEANGFDLAAKQVPYDEMLNHVTQITKLWNLVTSDERDGVYAVDKRQRVEILLRDLRAPIAQARPHAACEHCEGKGCKKCNNCGWWPRSVVEGMKK